MRKLVRVKPVPRGAGNTTDMSLAHIIYCPPTDVLPITSCASGILMDTLLKHGVEDDNIDMLGSMPTPVFTNSMRTRSPMDVAEMPMSIRVLHAAATAPPASVAVPSAAAMEALPELDPHDNHSEVVSIAWPAGGSEKRTVSTDTHAGPDASSDGDIDSHCGSPTWPPGMELQAFLELQEQLEILASQRRDRP